MTRFLTLTLDPGKIEGSPYDHMRSTWSKFREYLKRKHGGAVAFIAIVEWQKNGNPHLHVLLDRYINHRWISYAWEAVGGGFTNIKQVDVHRVSHYLSKYLTKELLLTVGAAAPKAYRRVTTSRSISLFGKRIPNLDWSWIPLPIERILARFSSVAFGVVVDEDGETQAFQLPCRPPTGVLP